MRKLNPALPLVWRNPFCVQIGIDPEHIRIENITPAIERFLAALTTGISESALDGTAEQCGLSAEEAQMLLATLSPALAESSPPQRLRIALDGEGPLLHPLGALLTAQGHHVIHTAAVVASRCDIAIILGDFVLEPHRAGDWLRRGIAHIPVISTESQIHIGPAINTRASNPSDSPCYHCGELARRDADAAWVAIATQLLSRTAAQHSLLAMTEACALIARWCENPQGSPLTSSTTITLHATTGSTEIRTVQLHPECACQALPQNVTVLDSLRGQRPEQPTRETALP